MQEQPSGMLSQKEPLVPKQTLQEANLYQSLSTYLMLKASKQTHS